MAQHVVDGREAVDVDHRQRQRRVGRARLQGGQRQRVEQLVEVGDLQQRVDEGLVDQPAVQQHVLEARRHAGAEHLDEVAVQRLQRFRVVDVGGQAAPVGGREIQRQPLFEVAASLAQAALQGGLHLRQAQLGQGALDQLAIAARGGDHPGRVVTALQAGLRTDQALGLDAQQRAQLADHALREQVHAMQLAQFGAGAHHHLQTAAGLFVGAHLAVHAHGHRQAGEQAHAGEFGLGAVVVDVVVADGVELGRVARLPRAQDDAHRFAPQALAHVAHHLQAGMVRLHHHVQQDHGQVLVPLHQRDRFVARVGVDQLERTPFDVDVAQGDLRGPVHVGIVVDDEHFPGAAPGAERRRIVVVVEQLDQVVAGIGIVRRGGVGGVRHGRRVTKRGAVVCRQGRSAAGSASRSCLRPPCCRCAPCRPAARSPASRRCASPGLSRPCPGAW